MYPVTNTVKALFDAEQKQVLRITGTDKNGVAISITDADVVSGGFNIDHYCCNGEKLEIGTAIAGQMTVKLNNVSGAFNGIVFEGAELFAEIGIADWSLASPTVTYIPCGYFTPDEQPRRLNNIVLTCLDRMTRFDVAVNAASLTFPATVEGLVVQVCTLCNVTLAASISALPNATVSIAALPDVQGDLTYRTLIQWCAGIMGTNAWFDWDGKLRFTWYDNATSYAMTTANRFNSDYYEDDLTVTGVVYTNSSGTEIVSGTDDYAVDLTGNALVGTLAATVMPAINTAVNGFTYRPFTATVINAPYLWPMDEVDFTDKDGNTYASVLTNVAYNLNGVTLLESKGMTYAVNARKQPSGVTREQAQLISEAMQAVETDIDQSLTPQDIFNRLTDNGAIHGLYMMNGQMYVNASYIQSGTLRLGGLNNEDGLFELLDASGNVAIRGDNTGFAVGTGTISTKSTGHIISEQNVTLAGGQVLFYGGNTYQGVLGFTDAAIPVLLLDSGISSGGLKFNGPQSQRTVGGLPTFYRPSMTMRSGGSIAISYHDLQLLPLFSDSTLTLGAPLTLDNGGLGVDASTAAGKATARENIGLDYAIYNSVTDLGLTSGSATILAAFNAMSTNTILICPAGEFASGEVPTSYGTVEIVKSSDAARSYVRFYGKAKGDHDWRMYLGATTYNGNDQDKPSGYWQPEFTSFVGNRKNNGDGNVGTSLTINFSNASTHMLMVGTDSTTRNYVGLVNVTNSGGVNATDIFKGSNVTLSTSTRALTLTFNTSSDCSFVCIPLRGATFTSSSVT